MGVVYCGPYAEQVGYEHEGYAARRLPGGELTATWTAATDEFTAYVAACACGWTGGLHPPTDDGEDAAMAEWEHVHLRPLIGTAARRGWSAWAARTGGAAGEVAALVAAGQVAEAAGVLGRLIDDALAWAVTLELLCEEQVAAGGGL